MKAWVLHKANDIRYEEIEKPQIKNDEVLVEVMAAGVCGSDIPRVYRDGAHNMPLVPGHEFSGKVIETGSSVEDKWLGKSVGIYPLMPCFECNPCKEGLHEMCRNYNYLGSRCNGGFAEYVAVPEKNLIEIPEGVAYKQSAMLEPMAVAVHAIRRVDISEDDVIAVCGLGTIGMLLIMFLRAQGYKNILAIGNKEYQREKLIEIGFAENMICNSRITDVDNWINEITESKGIDIYFECVGSNDSICQAINLVAPGGAVCLVGNPHSDIQFDKNIYWKILRNQIRVTGTWNSTFFTNTESEKEKETDVYINNQLRDNLLSDWEYAIELLSNKAIHPEDFISHELNLEGLASGLEIMRDKKENYFKVMIIK